MALITNLIPHGKGCTDVPSVVVDGKAYIGQAIPNKPKKDYEILSFLDNYGNRINWQIDLSNVYTHTSWDNCCLALNYTIYSVRRLSDGEVFTVGDNCIYKDRGRDVIKEFKIENGKLLIYFSSFATYLPHLDKVLERKKIITIEDGTALEGDGGYAVHPESSMGWNVIKEWHIALDVSSEVRQFLRLESAENWIAMNKPCLSVNDIKCWLERYFDYPNGINANELMEIVKEKINATT
jgi:hypothetical protein